MVKKAKALLILALSLYSFCGCNTQNALDVNKYCAYVCYDYHLACLDAEEQKAKTTIAHNGIEYTVWVRKPVGTSDDQFICAWVRQRHPLASPELVIMQNPDSYVDVFRDWSVKQIEIYCVEANSSKSIWDEDEPARTPSKILNSCVDSAVIADFVNFITNTDHAEKYILQDGFYQEMYNEDATYRMYIRVHFNESNTIVWDSAVDSYISTQSLPRCITIDKGRAPEAVASSNPLPASIDGFPDLYNWITDTIDSNN